MVEVIHIKPTIEDVEIEPFIDTGDDALIEHATNVMEITNKMVLNEADYVTFIKHLDMMFRNCKQDFEKHLVLNRLVNHYNLLVDIGGIMDRPAINLTSVMESFESVFGDPEDEEEYLKDFLEVVEALRREYL